jgi:putative flavoprotein involved in K+ transport
VPRVSGVNDGRPVLEDRRILDVPNVIWSTGFVRYYRWIRLPIFDAKGNPIHHRGVVQTEPGLYFIGLPFQSTLLSALVAGAGADAKYIAKQIDVRAQVTNLARRGKTGKLSRQISNTNETSGV